MMKMMDSFQVILLIDEIRKYINLNAARSLRRELSRNSRCMCLFTTLESAFINEEKNEPGELWSIGSGRSVHVIPVPALNLDDCSSVVQNIVRVVENEQSSMQSDKCFAEVDEYAFSFTPHFMSVIVGGNFRLLEWLQVLMTNRHKGVQPYVDMKVGWWSCL